MKSQREQKKSRRFSCKKRTIGMLCVVGSMLLLNLLAWCSASFSTWYANHIFPPISRLLSHICGAVPFSVGEILIAIGLLLLIVLPVSFVICMLRGKGKRWKCACGFGRILGWILTYILVTETCNCFILYHAKPFGETQFSLRSYTGQELLQVYEDLVDSANNLASQVKRDANGSFVLQDDLYETADAAMQKLGETYPQFQGAYPKPKKIHASYWMSQMNLAGIYFPFTLESNYNGDMMDINLPSTVCHEYSHLRGNIQEDEANFLAYLACIGSDSVDFQYSGVILALEYVQNALAPLDISGKEEALNSLSQEAQADLYVFLPEGYWAEKEETVPTLVATDTVHAASSAAMDTSLKLNGVDDGEQSYSRVVTLLLAQWDAQGKFSEGR